MMYLSHGAKSTLALARATYGDRNQISVAIEELNELACVLCKYIRYNSQEEAVAALKQNVVDELADVVVVMDHIKALFDVSDKLIQQRAEEKVLRVGNWLNKSKSMHQTLVDREVPTLQRQESFLEPHCENCANQGSSVCSECVGHSKYQYRCW